MGEGNDPLHFSDEWYSLGIVTEQRYHELLTQFQTGEDRHPEHYRWRAFGDFIKRNKQLPEDIVRRLYRLGESDPDWIMGGAMMAEVVWRTDCPDDVLNEATHHTSS